MNRPDARQLLYTVIAAFVCLLAVRPGMADQSIKDSISKVIKQARPAFVFIGGGSGAVISPDGYLITNAHVIQKREEFTIRLGNGDSHEAQLVGLNREGDLALLKIEDAQDMPHLPLGNSAEASVGEYCVAIGNPLALGMVDQKPSISVGVLSTKNLYRGTYNDALVTDAPVNPGNSGGPLLNMNGEIIGVIGQIETRWGLRANTGIGLALSSDQIERWLPKLKKAEGENVSRGYLPGIQWKGPRADTGQGAPVEAIAEGSPAETSGLKAGDVILGINDTDVWNLSRFRGILRGYPAESKITLHVQRSGEVRKINVQLRKPVEPGFKLDLAEKNGQQEVVVDKVQEDSAAEKAGLEKGDIVVAVGETELTGPADHRQYTAVLALRRLFGSGRAVTLTIKRTTDEDEEAVEKEIEFFPGGK